jgi:hypothetical protein
MKDGNKLPKVVREALESYANHFWQEDQGFGKTAVNAEKHWDESREKLIKWCAKIKDKK